MNSITEGAIPIPSMSEKVLILSPKDSINKIKLRSVETFSQEGNTLLVVFTDGRTRNYPLEHLWYYESAVGAQRSKP